MAKKKKQSAGMPSWVVTFALLMLGAFLSFLIYLNSVPAEKTQPKWSNVKSQTNKPQAKPQPAKPAATQPAKAVAKPAPKPDYDFYQLLEEQKVEVPKVDVYKSTPKTQKLDYQYRLQVASFRSQDDADTLRAALILEEGMQAEVQASEVNGSRWYRVSVGPYTNRSVMNKAQDKLVARGISPLELKEPLTK